MICGNEIILSEQQCVIIIKCFISQLNAMDFMRSEYI